MHTVMLIDDDYMTLLKLEKIFPWEKYSFKLVYSTTNSSEELHAMVKLNPDVIFTDISMCDLDGFDVIEHAKKRGLKALFVIISGYSSFDFAQKAIRHGVVDYMLKPVSAQDCDRILSKLQNIFEKNNSLSNDVPSAKFKISNAGFRQMIEFIDNNYMEQLTLSETADMFGLNTSYCCQLFQKYFNCSFSAYIISLKMNKALDMLSKSDMKISDIAAFLHYDYTHFCKAFKKHFGVTPYLYRKNHGISEDGYNEKEED